MINREFLTLTNSEIRLIVNDIFQPKSIKNIKRNKEHSEITCEITMSWEHGDITDVIILTEPDGLESGISVDFSLSASDLFLWQKFCIAKGCHYYLKDNPYIVKEV